MSRMTVVIVSVVIGLGVGIGIAHAVASPAERPANLPNLESPLLVPHQDYPDEACARCHGPDPNRPDVSVPITPHPERAVCRQCHLPMNAGAPLFRENTWGG